MLGERLSAQVLADSDQYQGGESAFRHAMTGPNQFPFQARAAANEFVRDQFRKAWSATSPDEALREFGIGLHTLQDSTSPSHFPFRVWTGQETNWQLINHVRQEIRDPGQGSALYRATEEAWGWYLRGRLPEGDLFRFGVD